MKNDSTETKVEQKDSLQAFKLIAVVVLGVFIVGTFLLSQFHIFYIFSMTLAISVLTAMGVMLARQKRVSAGQVLVLLIIGVIFVGNSVFEYAYDATGIIRLSQISRGLGNFGVGFFQIFPILASKQRDRWSLFLWLCMAIIWVVMGISPFIDGIFGR